MSITRKCAALLVLCLVSACANNPAFRSQPSAVAENTEKQAKSSQSIQEQYQLAQIAERTGKYAAALKIYQQLLEQFPANYQLQLDCGNAALKAQRYALASFYYQPLTADQALSQQQPALVASAWLGRARLAIAQNQQEKNAAEIVQFLQSAQRLDPENPLIWNSHGVLADLSGAHAKAQGFYQKALAKDPDNLEFTNNLGLSFILQRQPKQAVATLYPIYQQGRSTTKLRQNLALALGMLGDRESARQLLLQDLQQELVEQNLRYYQQLNQAGQ